MKITDWFYLQNSSVNLLKHFENNVIFLKLKGKVGNEFLYYFLRKLVDKNSVSVFRFCRGIIIFLYTFTTLVKCCEKQCKCVAGNECCQQAMQLFNTIEVFMTVKSYSRSDLEPRKFLFYHFIFKMAQYEF